MFTHFQSSFTSSPTSILLIPPVKYLYTYCPIFLFAVFCPVLPTPYFIITHPLLHVCIFPIALFIHFFECFPLFYFHPLSILFLYHTLFHFYFLGILPNVIDGLYRFYTPTIPFLRMPFLLLSQ